MNPLYFPLVEVLRLATATLQAPEHADSFLDAEEGRATGPALMWVKDAGTYLMSNARPRPADDVLYARAYSPTGPLVDEDEWDLARAICGGDDFAEYLRLDADLIGQLRGGAAAGDEWFVLEVSPASIQLRTAA